MSRSEPATAPVLRELRQWRFARSLETIVSEVGDCRDYRNRKKMQEEARNIVDRWLLSFQLSRGPHEMDAEWPIFPKGELLADEAGNAKLMSELVEKKFSAGRHNAEKIFERLRRRVGDFKENGGDGGGGDGATTTTVTYQEAADGGGAATLRVGEDFATPASLRVGFLVRNFGLLASARAVLRYESVGAGSQQWSNAVTVNDAMYQHLGVRNEGFASPLNSKMLGREGASFCSLFADTDAAFGSVGSFFDVDFAKRPGGWTVNPPFVESLMERVADKILAFCAKEQSATTFVVTFPRWTDMAGWTKLNGSQFRRRRFDLGRRGFTLQGCYGGVFSPWNDLSVFVVAGRPPPAEAVDKVEAAFRDTDVASIEAAWRRDCLRRPAAKGKTEEAAKGKTEEAAKGKTEEAAKGMREEAAKGKTEEAAAAVATKRKAAPTADGDGVASPPAAKSRRKFDCDSG